MPDRFGSATDSFESSIHIQLKSSSIVIDAPEYTKTFIFLLAILCVCVEVSPTDRVFPDLVPCTNGNVV